jgi:hypothetical protein
MCSGFGWDCCKKARSWLVGPVKHLHLNAEPGTYCPFRPYWDWVDYFVQRQNLVTMFALLLTRWGTADWDETLELALPANNSKHSRLPLYFVPDFHTWYQSAAIGIASI